MIGAPNLIPHEPLIVNLCGHSAGAIVFGTFLYLLLQKRKSEMPSGSWPAVAAASLALLWNAGSLSVLLGLNAGWVGTEWLACFTLSCLSVLPAVLFRLSLGGNLWFLTLAGYFLSAAAVCIQIEAVAAARPEHRVSALLLITAGFGTLTAVSAALLIVRRKNGPSGRLSRIVASMCLFLLAMSFLHLGSGHPMQAWSRELALHHCGIPLALFVLLQDYRFVLIDAFIRFLVNYLLAVAVALGAVKGALALGIIAPISGSGEATFTALVCVALIGFAVFRSLAQRWLTRVVFRRPGTAGFEQRVKELAAQAADEPGFLNAAGNELSLFMKSERFAIVHQSVDAAGLPGWVEATYVLHYPQGDCSTILLGRRKGGRQYLSEDHEVLARLGSLLMEEVGRLREAEVQRLVSGAELRALQSQINPHFLFNSLNALYGIIPRGSEAARRTVLNLSTIFRYLLQSPQTFVRVADEMQIVEAYLDIEKLRLGPRLHIELKVAPESLECRIPTLSIQPLVENAVKHGVAANSAPSAIWLTAATSQGRLTVTVENTLEANKIEAAAEKRLKGAGIGLANVRRRLELCFGSEAKLDFAIAGTTARAEFTVPAQLLTKDMTGAQAGAAPVALGSTT